MKILVLAAHPDDEALGCGATIAQLAQDGHNIVVMHFTNGVGGRWPEGDNVDAIQKRMQARDVAHKKLGVSTVIQHNFPDNQMDSIPLLAVCQRIEESNIGDVDLVFTHHPGCLNIDHQIVWRATMTAFRPQYGRKQKILSYFVPSSTDYNPTANFHGNVYREVSKIFYNIKIDALLAYSSEMRPKPHPRSFCAVTMMMQLWGAEVGVQYAEKFELMREIL